MKEKKTINMRYNNVILTATRWCAGLLVMGLTTLGSAVAQSHVVVSGNVFGGGNAAAVSGSTSVLMQDHALVENSVYGGGALANTGTYASSNTTTVTIAGGTVGDGTEGKGNVFGGALGDASHAPDVNGTVTVHIGTEAQVTADEANNVVIKGSVFGCNNAYGTPRKAVTVHIWRTKHTAGTDEVADAGFALQNVFGGGNQAHYTPTATQTASVIVHTCDNTIANLYGGGNAANVGVNGGTTAHVSTEIHGGRLGWVFGGGNGAGEGNPGANIYGNATLTVHAGIIEHLFGGSNEKGTITGTKDMQLLGDGECAQRDITEVYGGNNMAPGTDASLTISCPTGPATPWTIASVYGGSRAADLTGDVVLNIEGGTFGDVYGGNNQSGVIGGTVELNLYGGTITNAFGGNNAGGAINGVITVNVDSSRACPLVVNNVYGGGNLASYDPTGDGIDAPLVNIINGTVSESVYGGGYGNGAVVTANPQVTVGDNTASHHARVLTNVFGGGALADVEGNPTVTIKNDNSKVYGSVFGAGEGVETTNADDQKVALVKGNTTVSMTAGTVKGNIYGGGKMASVGDYTYSANGKAVTGLATANIGRTQVTVSGGTVGVEEADYTKVGDAAAVTGGSATREYGHTVNHKGHVFGGGLGKAGTNYAAYAFVDSARVDISGTAFVVGSVFGGGENGHVLENSGVHMNGGTVGQKLIYTERAINDATGAPNHHIYLGNVYGGGRGIDAEDHHFTATEGRVYGNTYVDISAGQVRHAVYGGGSLASVGTYVLDTISATDIKHYYIQNTGEAHVKVYGSAFIGHNGKDLEDDATDARAVHFLGAGKKAADLINANYRYLGSNCGMVYGSGRGLSSADPESDVPAIEKAEAAFTSFTYVTVDGSAQVCGSVFGGGENGHVKYNTLVQIKGGTIGGIPMHNADFNTSTEGFYDGTGSGTTLTNYYEDTEDESGVGPTVYRGNVYGGGRGVDHFGANLASGFSSSAGRVYGNTHVVVSGGTVYHHVFGGGSIASVGTYADNESPDEAKDIFLYKTYKGPLKSSYTDSDTINHSSGLTQVDIEGGVIGTTGHNEGSVFGGGRGIAGEFTWQIVHLAFVDRTIVNIKPGASVMGSVFGGGANGHVLDSTYVHLTGGIVGHPLEEADTLTTIYGYAPRTVFRGNVYGGGRGVDPLGAHKLSKTAGRVYGNTHVLMEGGWVRHSVFGGGSMASVGDYDTMTAAGTHDGFALKVGDVSGLKAGKDPSECGRAWVEITGGTVGSMARGTIYSDGGSYTDEMKTGQGGEGRNNGRVFGSCRGTAGEGYDHLAYVNITRVIIGTEGSATGPKIMGCVFGSGENGHVLDSTLVQMHSGEIGRGKIYDWKRTYIGNLYGGGRGIDLDHNNTLSSTAGWVRNSTHVEMTGGHVWHNVYGGGSLASVGPLVAEPTYTSSYDTTASKGRTWVEIKGGRVGRDGLFGGNVFGSGRGRAGVNTDTVFHLCNSACTYVPDVANPTSESVTIGSTSYGVRTLKKISNPAEDSLYLAVIPSKLTPYPDSIYYVLTAKADNSVKTVSHDFSERTNIHNAKVIVNFASNDTIVGGKRQGICGSVYGSGDNGHVLNLTSVNIKRGPIGNRIIFANAAARTAYLSKYPEADRDDINNNIASNGMVLTAGSVYGSGRGLDLANVGNNMSPTAGRVFGHTMVNVTGGHVMRNVYGGGNMAGVGEGYRTGDVVTSCHPTAGITTVKVSGGTIGMPYADVSSLEGTQCGQWGGNVFGSSRGLSSNEGLVKNMAYVRETHVNINNGTVYGSVFGGGENGHVWQNTYVTINGGTIGYDNVVSMDEPIYPGNVYGGGRGIDFTEASHVSRTSGAVYGNTNVLVTGGTIYHNVFGGGSLASVGRYVFYDTGDKPDSVLHAASASEVSAAGITPGIDSWGKSTVTVRGGIIGTDASNNGRVFGAGRGIAGQDGSGNAFNYYTFVDQTEVNIETGATINGCVFGSGDNGHVSGNAVVNVSGGTIGYDNGGPINGNVFGSGRGADRGRKSAGDDPYWYSATAGRVRGNTQVNITGGTIKNNIYGGGFMASVLGNTEVNIGTESGGPADLAIWGDVFGGSALGSIGTAGKTTTVNVLSGTIGSTSSYYYAANTALKGNIFGGGNGDAGVSASSETVTLYTDGTDTRIYQKAADVLNTVQVNIGNSSQYGDASKGATVLGNVFGCNNIAGSPQGDVHVDVYSTAHEAGDGISTGNVYPATLKGRVADVNVLDSLDLNALSSAEATALKATARFALSEVYGGGNKADYVPASASNTTGVTVHECEENTIQYVYGGGRAADIGNSSIAASTAVYIEGGHIKQVFAGGDGHTTDGSGNYLAANIKGDAIVTIEGGLVEQVFGGSNTTGMVEGTARVNFEPVNSCDLLLDEAFGGGNRAPGGGTVVTIPCGFKGSKVVYGGANEALITGNVILNIEGGTLTRAFGGSKSAPINGNVTVNVYGGSIDELFGGNDESGNITGTIEVNVDWGLNSCPDDTSLHYVYGGGYKAPYEPTGSYGPVTSGKVTNFTPVVNIIQATVDTAVFGGGYGTGTATNVDAHVDANPKVVIGAYRVKDHAGNTIDEQPNNHVRIGTSKNELGRTLAGNVFGGGNAGPVNGSPTVVIQGSDTKVWHNVYGGGNAAMVKGNPDVEIGGNVKLSVPKATQTGSTVTLTSREGATIYYTTDGTTPTSGSSEYSASLTGLAAGTVVKAIAYKADFKGPEKTSGVVTYTVTE